MKPTIPDTGTVIRLEGEQAVLRMNHDRSCSKCGAAALGMCKGGLMQELRVRNSKQARVGDAVKIGLVQAIQLKGYVLAYVVPPAALVVGSVAGHFLGAYTGFPPLDILTGFLSMLVVSFFSLRRLKRLDAANSIEIVQVLSSPVNPGSTKPDEQTLSDYYLSYF